MWERQDAIQEDTTELLKRQDATHKVLLQLVRLMKELSDVVEKKRRDGEEGPAS